MSTAAKFGLLILMALVIALARFLEGEVQAKPPTPPPLTIKADNAARPNNQGTTPDQRPAPGPQVPPPPDYASAREYVVQRKDTLGKISQRVYGSSQHWTKLLKANRTLLKNNPKRLKPGMKLVVPR